ncbi:MAG TPA: VIT family protein [Moraxellaceae bacterium]|nr:VIT family protein [Moraxellaceae bacterium]
MPRHLEFHKSDRIGWLRAAVLGANDGTISTSSLVVGVAAAGATQGSLLLTGVAGLVAGAMSMAAGEYVSVKSQADTEDADLAREKGELEAQPDHELDELTGIYMARGLEAGLARQVAQQMTAHNALEAHARDELGITETLRARPVQASLASAASFAVGASVPIATVLLAPAGDAAAVTTGASLVTLLVLGALAAYAGGASVWKGALRVAFWGALAMGSTALVGQLFGTTLTG